MMRWFQFLAVFPVLIWALLIPLSIEGAVLSEGDPLIPAGLEVGESFHLAFVTDSTGEAKSADIGFYNDFVQSDANSSTILGVSKLSWKAIGSTLSVDARDNAIVGGGPGTDNSPVYRLDHVQLANGYDSLWDGDLAATLSTNQNGQVPNGTSWVFTGSQVTGGVTAAAPLGESPSDTGLGYFDQNGANWIDGHSVGADNVLRFYALSEQLFIESSTVVTERSWRNNGSGDWHEYANWAPFGVLGAGLAVTGAPLPLTGGITVDMSGMDQILSVDEPNLMVTVQAGTMGGFLEEELNRRGFTLNHSPLSLGISTVGGWIATRSTGQFLSRYGGIEDLVVSLTVVLSSGKIINTKPTVRPAMGPDWKQLFLGAEGTLGIVTEVTLKIFPISNHRIFEAIEFDSVRSGLGVIQKIMQSGLAPFLIRFYDQDESRHLLGDETYARCVMFLGFEGLEGVVFALRHTLDALGEHVVSINSLQLTGGGGGSELWSQILADATGIPVSVSRSQQSTSLGAAMMAGVAAGVYSDYREAIRARFLST